MHAVYRAVFDQKMVLFYCIKFRKTAIVARYPFAFPGRWDRLTVAEYDDKLKIMPTFRNFCWKTVLYRADSLRKVGINRKWRIPWTKRS